MKGDLFINGIDAGDLGIAMGSGFLESLKSPASLKEFVENDDPTKDGKEIMFGSPKIASRELTLSFVVCGDSAQEHIRKYNAFVRMLQRGKISISAPAIGTEIYHLKFAGTSGGYSMSKDLTTSKLAIKFEEPNPACRIPEGAGPLVTSDDLTLATSDGDIFYLSEQYKMKFSGGEMDNRLTDIKTLLSKKKDKTIYENISGSTVVLDVKAGHDYTYGALASLTIKSVEDSPIGAFIRFISGSTKTTLVWPDSLQKIGYWKPAPNMAYEISIKNNIAIIQEFNTQINSKTMVTRNTCSAKSRPIPAVLSVVSADEGMAAGQYNSMYSGPEIDKLLTDAEQIPNKEDKPVVENISATDVTLNIVGGHEYLCGTLTSLTIRSTDGSGKESSVKFTSGDSATRFAWPDNMSMEGYTIIKANTTYEISIKGDCGIIVYAE